MAYDLTQVTTTYKALTALVKADLDEQLAKGRIKGTEYAETFKALMNTCLQLSMDTPLKDEQAQLYKRQREGFDDNLRQKMLEIQMNTWAMMFSSGLLSEKPTIITNDEVSDLYCYMKEQVLEEPCNTSNP